jgi:hypothetical protein
MDPDVYVGRLPCRYKHEVNRVVDKIITYETSTKGKDWFKKMAVVAGDSFDDISWNTSTDILEGQNESEEAIKFMDGFEPTRLWVEGGDVQLTSKNAEEVLSQGQGFVLFTGHGNPISWATHPHGVFNEWINFDIFNIINLKNGDKLPILVVGGCHNCQFDISVFKRFNIIKRIFGEANAICWGWLYASLGDGGSIVTIGNTGLGYGTIGDAPDPPDEVPGTKPDGIPDCIQYLGGWIDAHIFKVYNHDGKDIIGEAHGKTLSDYLSNFSIDWEMDWKDHNQSSTLVDCKTVQQWVLFGDPSLKIGGY